MNLWEISFRAQYEYPFIEMSRRYPNTSMSLWCIWNRELLQVPTQQRDVLEGVEKELRKGGWMIEKWGDAYGGRTFFLKDTCERWNGIWNIVEPHGCLLAPPAVFQDGWCYTRVLSFDEGRTREMFKQLRTLGLAELISKRELPLTVLPSHVWVHSLFAELTGKQMEALLAAHRHGYYNSPRQVGTQDVARSLGVSRSTYEEHLRKAENRVMNAIVPYLQLFAKGTKSAENQPMPGVAVTRPEAEA
jgi:hypothetical protein